VGSKRFNLSNQPERRNLYIKISSHGLNGHILTLKSSPAGWLDIFLRQNLSARVYWTHFYVKISPRGSIGHIFTQKSLRAG
jgi:hypothetical protein